MTREQNNELNRLTREAGGVIHPREVVAAARDAASPLHSCFTWDDAKAAEEYRVEQARALLQVVVQWIDTGDSKRSAKVFVSLSQDRKVGGYRLLLDVMSDDQLREQLLADALEELNRWQAKYREVKELASIFAAINDSGSRAA